MKTILGLCSGHRRSRTEPDKVQLTRRKALRGTKLNRSSRIRQRMKADHGLEVLEAKPLSVAYRSVSSVHASMLYL